MIFLDSKVQKKQNINEIIFNILIKIWNILKDELLKIEIENIQSFLNLIFDDVLKLFKKSEQTMENTNQSSEFEDLFIQIIEKSIISYKNYYPIYIKNNKEILEMKDDTIKSILEEVSNVNSLLQEIYLLINYFNVTNYTSYDKFLEQFSFNQNNYPVINHYLIYSQDIEKIKFLQNFNLINPFVV